MAECGLKPIQLDVTVTVTVTSRGGARVTDWTASDFEISRDGKRQVWKLEERHLGAGSAGGFGRDGVFTGGTRTRAAKEL